MKSYTGKISPDENRQRMIAARESATADVMSRLPGGQRNRFHTLLEAAKQAVHLRENALFEVGLAWRPLRRYLLELGRRMLMAGAISEADDVFWLTHNELSVVAADLDAGKVLQPIKKRVQERLVEWHQRQGVQPPSVLPIDSRPKFWWKYIFPGQLREQTDINVISGLGVSPGRVTAVARVISSPDEMIRLSKGEILVAHTTTPAWTPLFTFAAALITDLGGPLAHGSIIAREYGIPAVMGTGSATQRIRDGQVVTVDGAAGRVYLSSSELPAKPLSIPGRRK